MRLKFVSCVAAMLALCFTSMPAAAGCHGCGVPVVHGYTYAVPAYSYGYPCRRRCRRIFRRNCLGYRVHTVPSVTYTYAYPAVTYGYRCRRRRCW